MYPQLFHIYGPFYVQSYGVAICVGLALLLFGVIHNPLAKRYFSREQLLDVLSRGILLGVIGGRLLHVLSEPQEYASFWDIFKVWEGGLSSLGVVITVACCLPWYLYKRNIPVVPTMDLIAMYVPLLAMSIRIGCFLAGCCYGKISQVAWAIPVYGHGAAGECLYLHPVQLYSACLLFGLFLLLRYVIAPRVKVPGQLICAYLACTGFERFFIDFWRADQVIAWGIPVSIHQVIAFSLMCVGILGYLVLAYRARFVAS